MGPLFSLLLALGVLAAREYGFESGLVLPALAGALVAVPYLCAAACRTAALHGRPRPAARWLRVLGAAPIASQALAVCGLGWVTWIEELLGRRLSFFDWPRLEILLAFLPFVLFELAAIHARSRLHAHSRPARARLCAFQARLFLAAFAPLVLYVALSAALGTNEGLRVRIEEVGLYHTLYAGVLFLVLIASLPWLLVRTLDTLPIPEGPLRSLLDRVAQLADFRAAGVYGWNTGGNMANAAIVGLGARTRVVLFSDALLQQLDPRELAAVYAHEIAHAKKNHVPVFAAWVMVFFLGGDLLTRALFPDDAWLAAAGLLATLGGWFLFFGWLSRRCELEADLFAIELLGDPAGIVSALERVGGQLRDVAGWRHFSTARRVAFLERAAHEPELGRRLTRRIRAWSWAGVALLACTGALEGLHLVRAFGADRVRAELRLGEYASALEHAGRVGELEPELRALLERARSLERAEVDAAELERAARAALAHDDLQAALEFLELGVLRGGRELGDVALALLDPQRTLPEALAHSWEAELARARRLAPQAAGSRR